MARDDRDRDRLLGTLAVQVGFATRDELTTALGAWNALRVEDSVGLGQILVNHGILTAAELALLEALVEKCQERHGYAPQQTMATLSMPDPVRQWLGPPVGSEFQPTDGFGESRTHHVEDTNDSPESPAVGTSTGAGQRFRILRPHARGGLGQVSVALDEELHREVALKELQERFVNDAKSRARFLLEAEITGSLEHPGVVPIYGRGQYRDGRPFYAMRLIKGESLKSALNRLHRAPREARREPGEWNWEFRRLLRRFLDVCNTVEYAHSRGVLHRDLKPDNVMLGEYGEALVVDWGLAKVFGRTEVDVAPEAPPPLDAGELPDPTVVGRAVGTWLYMSPEQAAGLLDQLGPVSDVYSLGATLYHLLTGQPPFKGVPRGALLEMIQVGGFLRPREVNPDVPAPLEAICLKAMCPKAEGRHPSARALAGDLERWLDDEPIAAYQVAVAYHERRIGENPHRFKDREALARIHSNLGNALHFLGRNVEAEVVHRTALAEFLSLVVENPRSASHRERLAVAYSNLGWVLRALGKKDDADQAYNASLAEYKALTHTSLLNRSSNDPGLTALFVSQGWPSDSDSSVGDPSEEISRPIGTHPAPPKGEAGSPREPDDFAAFFERGKLAHKAGARDQAIADYTAAIRIDPTFAEVYNRRGNAYLDKGECDRAISDYSRAIRLDPEDPVLYYNRGKAFEAKSEHNQAIADFTEAIRIDPQFTKAHIRRSKAYNALDR